MTLTSTPPPRAAATRSLIAVDGIDGSGKSVLAACLTSALADANAATVLLAVDDFRRPVDFGRGGRAEADIYYEEYYDLPLLDRCLTAFVDGVPSLEIPVFDAAAHRLSGRRTILFGDATFAVIEGVFALRLTAVSTSAALIYVRTSFEAARHRILARDRARGRTQQDVDHRIAARYFPAQERYLRAFNPTARADVLIDHETLGAPRVLRLNSDKLGTTGTAALSRALRDFAAPPTVG